jgi:two-component system LytT family sensor kinase
LTKVFADVGTWGGIQHSEIFVAVLEGMSFFVKNLSIIYQVFLWTLFFAVFHHYFLEEFEADNTPRSFLVYSLTFFSYLFVSLFNIYLLIPYLFKQGRYIFYVFALFLLTTAVAIILNRLVVDLLPAKALMGKPHIEWIGYFFYFCLFYVGTGMVFFLTRETQQLNSRLAVYEKQKVESELRALKAQVNPHLLFNTLNNIYSLSLEKSDRTPEIILKLSELMSYVLYDCRNDLVKLKKEIDFLDSYIDLEKSRFEQNIIIEFDKRVDDQQITMAPLIFLPFVENAFKHTGAEKGEKPRVSVLLIVEDHSLVFSVVNTVQTLKGIAPGAYSGIGIENISKKLKHLYPDRHTLDINQSETQFSVRLQIDRL